MRTKDFCGYHAGHLAIDPYRPWQVISNVGCVLAKLRTEHKATMAVTELQAAQDAGTLPNNVGTWEKKHLLEDE